MTQKKLAGRLALVALAWSSLSCLKAPEVPLPSRPDSSNGADQKSTLTPLSGDDLLTTKYTRAQFQCVLSLFSPGTTPTLTHVTLDLQAPGGNAHRTLHLNATAGEAEADFDVQIQSVDNVASMTYHSADGKIYKAIHTPVVNAVTKGQIRLSASSPIKPLQTDLRRFFESATMIVISDLSLLPVPMPVPGPSPAPSPAPAFNAASNEQTILACAVVTQAKPEFPSQLAEKN